MKIRNSRGFSFVEVLLVIVIVILVVSGIVLALSRQVKQSRVDNFKSQMIELPPYISACLSDNGALVIPVNNNDMVAESGGEICSSSNHGKHFAPKERGDCDGDGVYKISVNSQLDGFEAVCNLSDSEDNCVAKCFSSGCEFEGECN